MKRISLTKSAIKKIHAAVDKLFERAKLRFLAKPPVDKRIYIGIPKPLHTLPSLFEAASAEEHSKADKHLLDGLLAIAEAYVDAQRSKTKAQVTKSVEVWLNKAKEEGVKTDLETVLGGELAVVWGEATNGMKRIVEAEANNAKNTGAVESIVKFASTQGIDDPIVYFVVVRDDSLCEECRRLHLMPNGDPRLWYLSEISHAYHKKGVDLPSIMGEHPNCFGSTTRLHTNRGLLTVEELYKQGGNLEVTVDCRVGAEIPGSVWFKRHNSGARQLLASPVYDTGIQECLRVEFESGQTLEVTGDHEMWVDTDKAGVKKMARDLSIGDKIPLISGCGGFGTDNFPELAELMGYSLCDGSLSKKPRRVPNRIWGADKKTISGFLRGLFAAYGHSEDAPAVVLSQNDREFLKEIQLLISNFGICSKLYAHGIRKPCYRLFIGGWAQVTKFAEEIGFGVETKQSRLFERLEKTKKNTRLGAYRTTKVLSITPIGPQQTYCLTEPMTNTVTANGIVTGQCRCSLVYLAAGFGFKNNQVEYIGPNHDEMAKQRGL